MQPDLTDQLIDGFAGHFLHLAQKGGMADFQLPPELFGSEGGIGIIGLDIFRP